MTHQLPIRLHITLAAAGAALGLSLIGCGGFATHDAHEQSTGEISGLTVASTPVGGTDYEPAPPPVERTAAAESMDEGGAMDDGYRGTTTEATGGAPAPRTATLAMDRDEAMVVGGEAEEDVSVTTTTVTVTERRRVEPQVQRVVVPRLTATAIADHDRRGAYLDFLQRQNHLGQRLGLDLRRRVRFRVVDAQGTPVPDARITLGEGQQQNLNVVGTTHADGVWDYFPGVVGSFRSERQQLTVRAAGHLARGTVTVPRQGDGVDVLVTLPELRVQRQGVLDLAFVIDVTGSMGDELAYVTNEVGGIVARVRESHPEASIRVGAVLYRDRSDSQPLQRIDFTANVNGFAQALGQIRAGGGGDYPEDLNAGLEHALRNLAWRQGGSRILALIADAPPKSYGGFDYQQAMRRASQDGIRILPVAASGADRTVEYLFRAMGAVTSTPYVTLTDHSGIGGSHLRPDTDRASVEMFSELLVRLLMADLAGMGMHEPDVARQG